MNQQKNYQNIVNHSSLRFSIKKNCHLILSQWHENAKIKYQDYQEPRVSFNMLEAEKDILSCLSSAIQSLVQETQEEKKQIPGWSYGYVCGYTQGALHSKWSNTFLAILSKEFRGILKIKAVYQLLKHDSSITTKIEKLDNYFTNLEGLNFIDEDALPDNVVSINAQTPSLPSSTYRKELMVSFIVPATLFVQ